MVTSPPPATTHCVCTTLSVSATSNVSTITPSAWDFLPEEVLERILNFLSLPSLLRVLPVCHRWRRVAEGPRFWVDLKLRVKAGNLSIMPEVLRLPRLQHLRRLRVSVASERLFQALLDHPGLQNLDARCCDLSGISPELLAKVVAQVNTVIMFTVHLRPEQAEALFRAAGQPKARLRKLHLGDNWQQGTDWDTYLPVSPGLLAAASRNLEHLEMPSTGLEVEQVRALLVEVGGGQGRMRYLNLKHNSLRDVAPWVVGRAVNCLETAILKSCNLTRHQVTSILEQAQEGGRLQELDVAGNWDAKEVAVAVLDRTRGRISKLRLWNQLSVSF